MAVVYALHNAVLFLLGPIVKSQIERQFCVSISMERASVRVKLLFIAATALAKEIEL